MGELRSYVSSGAGKKKMLIVFVGLLWHSSGLDSMLPLQQGAWVGSQVRELGPTCCLAWTKKRDVFLHGIFPIIRKASSQEGMEGPTITPITSP